MKKQTTDPAVTPETIDGMPVEVATAMLTGPKVKLSNRMRKNCAIARQKVFTSEAPLYRDYSQTRREVIEGKSTFKRAVAHAPKSLDTKINARIRRSNLKQLLNLLRRSAIRRLTIQRDYLKLTGDEPKVVALRTILERRALVLEELHDAAAIEIAARTAKKGVAV